MPLFKLSAGEQLFLELDGQQHWFETREHPVAKGMAHVMEGGQARVFHLETREKKREHALKVLKRGYSSPAMVDVCARLDALKRYAGLAVCYRVCFSPQRAAATLRQHPGLAYSILMPWVRGLSWLEVVENRRPLPKATARELASSLVRILAQLESLGMAHSDISSGNVVIDLDQRRSELIDVEDLFAPSWPRPAYISLGTPGYQHRDSGKGQWHQHGDRFAAAILLSEMLGWYDDGVRAACHGDSFFDPSELQQAASRRFESLLRAVEGQSRLAAALLVQAWGSQTLADCPPLRDWLEACLPEIDFEPLHRRPPLPEVTTPIWTPLARASANAAGSVVQWDGSFFPGAGGARDQVEWTQDAPAHAPGVQWEGGATRPGKNGS